MRSFLFALLLVAATSARLMAGQLNIAIIQFPEKKTLEDLNQAFATQNLYDVTSADRTRSKVSYLKGGTVLFAQSVPMMSSGHSTSSTRIGNQCAEVQASLGGGRIAVSIELTEGVKAGLRSLQAKHYEGSGPLSGNAPSVLGLAESSGKIPQVVKNRMEITSYDYMTAIVAQYTP